MSIERTEFGRVLGVLKTGEVQFILMGGLAAMAHGTARATSDVDVVYARNAGRVKDLEPIAELQALLEERRKQK